MASAADFPKMKKKPMGPTAREAEAAKGLGTQEDVLRARERAAAANATSVQGAQSRAASQGAYAGLGLAERAAAEKLKRSGEAKTAVEAADMVRKRRKKPKANIQAGALED